MISEGNSSAGMVSERDEDGAEKWIMDGKGGRQMAAAGDGSGRRVLAEPISNCIGGLACFITMYFTLYRKLRMGRNAEFQSEY